MSPNSWIEIKESGYSKYDNAQPTGKVAMSLISFNHLHISIYSTIYIYLHILKKVSVSFTGHMVLAADESQTCG